MESAEKEGDAKLRLAEAALVAKQKDAEGKKSVDMVPVQVADAQVEVNRKQVEVLNRELEAKDSHQQAAIALEVAKLQIQAGQVVGIEMAKAIGQFMGNGDFNIFGSPETLADMTAKFAGGLGLTQILQGVHNGHPVVGDLITKAIETAGAGLDAVKAKAEEATGKGKGKGKETPPSTPA